MDVIQEVEMGSERHLELEDENRDRAEAEQPVSKKSKQGFVPPPLRILDHVKINVIAPETPMSTIKGLLRSSKSDLSFSKRELRKAEELLSQALKEIHHKLRLLKSYRC